MSDFPSIQLPSGRKRKYVKAQLKTDFEAGYVLSRAKHTRGRWVWTLTWETISLSDFAILLAHFDENVGSAFTCAYDMLNETSDKTVRYASDELEAENTYKGYCKVSIQLEEE